MISLRTIALFSTVISGSLVLAGCGSSSSGGSDDPNGIDIGLPKGLTLSFLSFDSSYHAYNTDTLELLDLNEAARYSQDSAVQSLEIKDTSTIGHFFHWPDFREVDGAEVFNMSYLLMKPGYTTGSDIDSNDFVHYVHFHGEDLAAHSGEEFANPETGSAIEAAMLRLNDYVVEQSAIHDEVADALNDTQGAEGQSLCRAFVDPYLQFESEHAHEDEVASEAEDDHAHGALVHIALTDTGRLYFFAEAEHDEPAKHDGHELVSTQGFVPLEGVGQIADCARTTIARANDDGVLVFIPDTQTLYYVDNHGADWHQHSRHALADLNGLRADMVAILGSGDAHEHDHDGDDHDH